jgi:UDP-N-acetylmuramate dehydrogenase
VRTSRALRVASRIVPTLLADLTTLRLGGPAARSVTATSRDELVDAVRAADAAGEPVLILGGGSNLVVGDDGWPGVVVQVRMRGSERTADGDRVAITAQAGEPWDELVAATVAEGLTGLGRCPASPASSARHRSRTSAPTAARCPT